MTTSDGTTYVVQRGGGKEVLVEVPANATLELLSVKQGGKVTSYRLLVKDGDKLLACFTDVYSFYPEDMEPKKREYAGN